MLDGETSQMFVLVKGSWAHVCNGRWSLVSIMVFWDACLYWMLKCSGFSLGAVQLKKQMENDAEKIREFKPFNILPLETPGVVNAFQMFPEVGSCLLVYDHSFTCRQTNHQIFWVTVLELQITILCFPVPKLLIPCLYTDCQGLSCG